MGNALTVSTFFNEELALVDPTKSFTYALNASTHGENEYSVVGWTVTGGSEEAQAMGASRALYDLGFRFYSPQRSHYPASVSSGGVTIAKREDAMPFARFFCSYGWGGVTSAADAFDRWATLNCLLDQRRTVGQTWLSVINAINAQDSFFTNNPTYLAASDLFNLDNGAIEAAVVDRVAAQIVASITASGGNFYPFGVSDGSSYTSDEIVRFSNAIIARVRETIPDATLGILAYSNAAAPPTIDCPDLYVQVALAYGDAGLGYGELINQWGAKAGGVGLRAYGEIPAWNGFLPMNASFNGRDYWSVSHPLPNYIASGANAINMETAGNFVQSIVSHYHTLMIIKNGSSDYDSVQAEIVQNVFDGDSAVADLFTFWAGNETTDGRILQSCSYIDAMADSDYKLEFQQFLAVTIAHQKFEYKTNKYSPTFFRRVEKNLRWWHGLRFGPFQSYPYTRRISYTGIIGGRTDLDDGASPHWARYPVAPTAADYAAMRDDLQNRLTQSQPAEVAQIDDLVIVDVMPEGAAGDETSVPSTIGYCNSQGVKIYVQGPGDLTLQQFGLTQTTETITFGAGLYSFVVADTFRVDFGSGLVWIDAYEGANFDYSQWTPSGDTPQPMWMFVPEMVRGKQAIWCETRFSIADKIGNRQIKETWAPYSEFMIDPRNIETGIVRVRTNLARGEVRLLNVNRYLSLHPRKMLMPRALAKAEFPSVSFGKVA